jgi:lipopolysaccharide export system permease protein
MLSQLMTLFGFFSLVLIMVYWINRAVILFDQLIADGQSAGVFIEFTALSLPQVITIVLPLSAFAASLYVTNRMSGEAELTVVQATGFSPWRLARPVAIFGLVVTALMSVLTHVLAPAALTQLNAREAEIAETATARLLREGQFITPVDGVTVYVREVTPAGEFRDIFLSDQRADGEKVTYTAARAYLVQTETGPQLVMVDGAIQTLRMPARELVTTGFDDLVYGLGPLLPDAQSARRSSRELSTLELLRPSDAIIAETRKSAEVLRAEGHDRFADAALALVAALLGFATLLVGQFSRFGVWRQMVAAIFLVIAVKGIETLTTAAIRDDPARWALAYLPAGVGLAVVVVLLARAARPGPWRLWRRGREAAA